MAFDPKQCRILLVGKLMARLEGFLKQRGYALVEAHELGSQGLAAIGEKSFHLVLLELNLRDVELRDFFADALVKQHDASFIIFAQPTEAEGVVSALVLGADGYVPLPPDEDEMFRVLARAGQAAVMRKVANPDAQPGSSAKVKGLEEELEKLKAQVVDLEEQRSLYEAEGARLKKVADDAKLEAKKAPPSIPPGHKIVAEAELEELSSKATFAEFLESENDELKKERDRLVAKLRGAGLSDDESDEEGFDEPTGHTSLGEESAGELLADDGDNPFGDGAGGDEEELVIFDDASGEVPLELEDRPAKKPAPAPAPAPAPVAAAKPARAAAPAAPAAATTAKPAAATTAKPAAATIAKPAAPTTAKPAPKPAPVPPPVALAERPKSLGDDFEDVNTDALLSLADELSSSMEGESEDLDALLASIDDD